MSIRFNAHEVLTVAIKIEENAAAFYRRARELHGNGEFAKTFEDLAKMEDTHQTVYEEMRAGLGPEEKAGETYDPFEEASLYLGAVGDFHGGEGNIPARDRLTGKESMDEIFEMALDLERKSILFYLGLKDMVPEHLGRDKIDWIIGEEKKHVVQIARLKAGL